MNRRGPRKSKEGPLGPQRTVEEVLEEELGTKSGGKLKLWRVPKHQLLLWVSYRTHRFSKRKLPDAWSLSPHPKCWDDKQAPAKPALQLKTQGAAPERDLFLEMRKHMK